MNHPAHVDGCSVVILLQGRRGFRVLESGVLDYDGSTLWLGEGKSRREFSDEERESLMPVAPGNRIPECRGFDFFLIASGGRG
jgi:hypothetical protein